MPPTLIARCTLDPDYPLAQRRYAERRRAALEFARDRLGGVWGCLAVPAPLSALRLAELDADALSAWHKWPRSPYPDANFPWDRICTDLKRRPRRFEVAIWNGSTLCGLSVGLASKGDDNVTIRFLEGRSGDNPLRGFIALIAVECAKGYAVALGKRRVKLKNPNAGAIPRYADLGFSLAETARGATYYVLGVDDDDERYN